MARFNCPECGSSNTSCTYDDGGGNFGESIIEEWVCEDCDAEWSFDMGYDAAEFAPTPDDDDQDDGQDDYPQGDILPPEYGLSDLPF